MKASQTHTMKRYAPYQVRLLRCEESDGWIPPSRILDTPQACEEFWHQHVTKAAEFTPEQEMFVAVSLSTRKHVMAWRICSVGLMDSVLVHPREVFRAAILDNAHSLIVMHNHPSGDPTPSEADIRTTRDLIRAGQLLRIELVDHVVIGSPSPERPRGYCSLRESGHFYK